MGDAGVGIPWHPADRLNFLLVSVYRGAPCGWLNSM
jgi:hypothetical protein